MSNRADTEAPGAHSFLHPSNDLLSPYESSQLKDVPITPIVERSHFSPTTPAIEKGFAFPSKRNELNRSLSSLRISNRPPSSQREHQYPYEYNRRHSPFGRLLLYASALILILLVANVIYLDVRLALAPQRATEITPSAQKNTVTSSSMPPAPSSVSAPNLAALPPASQQCISQLHTSATSDPSSYCAQCVPALADIPSDWFVAQARNTVNGQANLLSVNSVSQYCTNHRARSSQAR